MIPTRDIPLIAARKIVMKLQNRFVPYKFIRAPSISFEKLKMIEVIDLVTCSLVGSYKSDNIRKNTRISMILSSSTSKHNSLFEIAQILFIIQGGAMFMIFDQR
jgi:hypothetical protein